MYSNKLLILITAIEKTLTLLLFNHLSTIRKYSTSSMICSPLQNLLKPAQKYGASKIRIVHDVDEGLSFLLRGRDFLCPV